jgi:hypothetical protein
MYRVVYLPDFRQGILTVRFTGSAQQCIEYMAGNTDLDMLDSENRLCRINLIAA